jgi:hypothetical protein
MSNDSAHGTDSKKEFDEGFARLQEAENFYNRWVHPHSPKIEETQKVISYGQDYYFEEVERPGPFEKIYQIYNRFNPTLAVRIVGNWYDVNMQTPGDNWQAVEAWNLNRKQGAEYQAFSQIFSDLQNKRTDIFASFVEPTGFWN